MDPDPDPGGPKTYASCGFGSATLIQTFLKVCFHNVSPWWLHGWASPARHCRTATRRSCPGIEPQPSWWSPSPQHEYLQSTIWLQLSRNRTSAKLMVSFAAAWIPTQQYMLTTVQESNLCQADGLLCRRMNTYTAIYAYNCPGIEPLPSWWSPLPPHEYLHNTIWLQLSGKWTTARVTASVVNPHWFQCWSGSGSMSGFGSESRDWMNKNSITFRVKKIVISFDKNLLALCLRAHNLHFF